MDIQVVAVTVAVLAGATAFITACVKAILAFGELRAGVRSAGNTLASLATTLEHFAEEVRRDLRDHDGRLRVLEDRAEVVR